MNRLEPWENRLSIAHGGHWEVYKHTAGQPEQLFTVRFHYEADELRDLLNAQQDTIATLQSDRATAVDIVRLIDEAISKRS